MANITLDSLAGMIQNQFGEVSKQFDEASKQLGDFKGEVNKHFDELEKGQGEISLKLTNVAYRFELKELEGKVSFLEREVAELKAKLK